MKKFLVVGVGGSGGATLHYMIDQLRADLRSRGVNELPAAWQFVHIDVNPQPEQTPGLGSIRDLGGRYVAVSSAGNSFRQVRQRVEARLTTEGERASLLGWTPSEREGADGVPVSTGAGQYRAVGRMLTLTRLHEIRQALTEAWQDLHNAGAWGDLPEHIPEEAPYDSAGTVLTLLVGSLAGGSGASMFLDVARVMGRIPGLKRDHLGVFLFTPDVFVSLDPARRKGVDGNALAAFGELLAAQTRAGGQADSDLFRALGLGEEHSLEVPFGRVLPIGGTIGGDGAKFGETTDHIYRGLGRALAATIVSDRASVEYERTRFQNLTPPTGGQELFGWGAATPAEISWGAFGYASLSLGRDRYGEYAAQRLARAAVTGLVDGHSRNAGVTPASEQLDRDIDSQWDSLMADVGLPRAGQKASNWLDGDEAASRVMSRSVDRAVEPVVASMDGIQADTGKEWLAQLQGNLRPFQSGASQALASDAYAWAEEFATRLEEQTREQVLEWIAHPRRGLEFARRVLDRLVEHADGHAAMLTKAPSPSEAPLSVAPTTAAAYHKTAADHVMRQDVVADIKKGARTDIRLRLAHHASAVLHDYVREVLPALRGALVDALADLTADMNAPDAEAGLAQLRTTRFREWPGEQVVPARFDQAHNEVLVTTSADFPTTFEAHVQAKRAGVTYRDGLDEMAQEIVRGTWQAMGAARSTFPVITVQSAWRPTCLPRRADTLESTPPTRPSYHIAVRSADILERALAYQARKDQDFATFSQQTFEGYLNQDGIPQAERDLRRRTLAARFREAVEQAQPLVGVSGPLVEALYNSPLTLELTFSTVPLAKDSPAAVDMVDALKARGGVERESITRLEEAFSAHSPASKIAIYGSYPKYLPMVFTSLLEQLRTHWAGLNEEGRRELYKWKRARPIPAAIGMSPEEQKAMVKGWYLGRALGLVQHPTDPLSDDPVSVREVADEKWLHFPARLLTPRERFTVLTAEGGQKTTFDWLAAVLEGHTLAMIAGGEKPFEALYPYRALRRIYDRALLQPSVGETAGERLVAAWLADGKWPAGVSSQITKLAEAGSDGVARAEALHQWLQVVRQHVADTCLSDPSGMGPQRRHIRLEPGRAPEDHSLFTEISLVTYEAVDELVQMVESLQRREQAESHVPQV